MSSINVFVLQEPNEYFGHHDWVIQNKSLFSIILTWSDKVLNLCENAVFIPFGSPWITDDIASNPRDKKFCVGHLCGELLLTFGHQMRHEIFARQDEIKIEKKFLFKGTRQLPEAIHEKGRFFGEPMFAVVIENTSHNGYFTEKISDCMLLKTVPIYWGCSNIEKFYNKDGFLIFRSPDEFIKICNSLTPELYAKMLPAIEENFLQVEKYKMYEKRICQQILEILKYNNVVD
jgi:hypothetical protein